MRGEENFVRPLGGRHSREARVRGESDVVVSALINDVEFVLLCVRRSNLE